LLDSYEIECKPHVTAIVATAKEFGKIIGELDPTAARARDERLREELKLGQAVTIRPSLCLWCRKNSERVEFAHQHFEKSP